jgi:hypothetical protein
MRHFILCLLLLGGYGIQNLSAQQCQNHTTGNIPIPDLGNQWFHGMSGGLYGQGNNLMPAFHQQAGIALAQTILPLNNNGQPSAQGKIGFISMGMSNANMFFAGLRDSTFLFAQRNPTMTMVNGASGGYDIMAMLDTTSQYWPLLQQKLQQSGLHPLQVQVIWFMQARHISGLNPNEGLSHIDSMENRFLQSIYLFKQRFPNLKQVFCSGRDYGGYSNPGSGNPEPFAYYTNWAFRRLIDRQLSGDPALAFNHAQSPAVWLAWADHVWADGENPRQDGFVWLCPEDVQTDGVHPSPSGKAKVAHRLFQFFKTDTTTTWYRQTPALAFQNLTEKEKVSILYHPTEQTLQLLLHQGTLLHFELRNFLGQKVLHTQEHMASVQHLLPGMYLIFIQSSQGNLCIKWMKTA